MKKGRPGYSVHLLCPPALEQMLTTALLAQSSTLGVRRTEVSRTVLDRWFVSVQTDFGDVRIKVGGTDGRPWHAAPEYEDCAAIARKTGVPLSDIYQMAIRAWESTT